MAFRKLIAAGLAAMLLASGSTAALAAAPTSRAIIAAAAPESVGFSAEGLRKLDAHMQGLVDTGHLPGVTTMLVR
ncbi:MAG TPA: serine hydrolase, partial [Caulobacter sp.]|nr:serine hydrolase [Caulobacter sp.]